MMDPAKWQESNTRQLAAEIAALRERLERFAASLASTRRPEPGPAAGAPEASRASVPVSGIKAFTRSSLLRLVAQSSPPPPSASAAPAPTPTPVTVEPPRAEEFPSALDQLTQRLALSPFERNILLLCAAVELDTRIAGLCAQAQDHPHRSYPTFALALALFDDPLWDALSPERPLRYWRLIEISQPGTMPLTASALRADERIVSYIKGLNYLDERLLSYFVPLELDTATAALAPSQGEAVEAMLKRWQQQNAEPGLLPVVQLVGADPISKQLVAGHTAAQLGRRLYRLPVESLPAAPADLEFLARLWQREGRLMPVALYLDADDLDGRGAESISALSRFLSRSDGVFFLGVREVLPRPGRGFFAVDAGKPSAAEQQAVWSQSLGPDARSIPEVLSAQFNLNLATIQKLAQLAKAESPASAADLESRVWAQCCLNERPRLDTLAQRLEPKMAWGDLVLPPGEMSQLRQVAAQVRQRTKVYRDWGFDRKMNRGFGISALFAGESGTGKTMAAEVIANDLRLNLYRIDLSAVVNKYIGETEKNLRRLFDAAEDGGAILFFDEADALFGKRSEVKDSHDRYANIEINYLLQRIESYRGLAILATNMKGALDTAFLRRLRFIVNFPFPGPADRRRLWQQVFLQPDRAKQLPAPPLAELDYEHLARLNLAGGDIWNAALNAAFLAAQAGSEITMPLVLQAARAEFQKHNRPVNEADFRRSDPVVVPKKGAPIPA